MTPHGTTKSESSFMAYCWQLDAQLRIGTHAVSWPQASAASMAQAPIPLAGCKVIVTHCWQPPDGAACPAHIACVQALRPKSEDDASSAALEDASSAPLSVGEGAQSDGVAQAQERALAKNLVPASGCCVAQHVWHSVRLAFAQQIPSPVASGAAASADAAASRRAPPSRSPAPPGVGSEDELLHPRTFQAPKSQHPARIIVPGRTLAPFEIPRRNVRVARAPTPTNGSGGEQVQLVAPGAFDLATSAMLADLPNRNRAAWRRHRPTPPTRIAARLVGRATDHYPAVAPAVLDAHEGRRPFRVRDGVEVPTRG